MDPTRLRARLDRYGALGLALALVVVYVASLRGGFLNYDDPWLIEQNPLLRRSGLDALLALWTDRGEATRLILGAEYLPVRDTSLWLEARLWGLSPHALRATNLVLYVAAALVFRAYLRRALPREPVLAEVTAWLFALHPVHAESAAWLAGRKDVLALLFMGLALWCYAGPTAGASPTEAGVDDSGAARTPEPGSAMGPVASVRPWDAWRAWAAVPLVLLACLSKGVAVVTPLLFVVHDLLVGRRPRFGLVGASLGAALGVLSLHVQVGRTMGMLAALPGGGRMAAVASMGPAWLEYLGRAFVPVGLSVSHEVPDRSATDLLGWLAYVPWTALLGLALWRARRGSRLELAALLWFAVALAPTSQILAPLQNRMADRYLLAPVLGPCLLAASLLLRLGRRRAVVVAAVVTSWGFLSAERANLFADSVRLWSDAVEKTTRSQAPYQLGMALRERGDDRAAEQAFRLAILRSGPGDETGRRAINNLSVLLGANGRHGEALALLAEAVRRFPMDPRVLNNLAELTARHGDPAEARRLFDELVRRFPTYEPGLANHRRRYPPSPSAPVVPVMPDAAPALPCPPAKEIALRLGEKRAAHFRAGCHSFARAQFTLTAALAWDKPRAPRLRLVSVSEGSRGFAFDVTPLPPGLETLLADSRDVSVRVRASEEGNLVRIGIFGHAPRARDPSEGDEILILLRLVAHKPPQIAWSGPGDRVSLEADGCLVERVVEFQLLFGRRLEMFVSSRGRRGAVSLADKVTAPCASGAGTQESLTPWWLSLPPGRAL